MHVAGDGTDTLAMYRILSAVRAERMNKGYHNYDSRITETLSTEMNIRLLMSLRLKITATKVLEQLLISLSLM